MTRRRSILKRQINPDYRYDEEIIAKFIHIVMRDGKKSTAETVIYDAFDFLEKRTKKNPVDLFKKALENVKPIVEVRSKRIGSANYQVPTEVPMGRKINLALRWIRDYAKKRMHNTMSQKIAEELLDAAGGRGGAFKKKDDIHRMAEANKAFAHYR